MENTRYNSYKDARCSTSCARNQNQQIRLHPPRSFVSQQPPAAAAAIPIPPSMIPAPAPPPPAQPHLHIAGFDTWPPHDPDPPAPIQGTWERILPAAPALDNAEPRGRGGRRRNCPSPGRRARSLRRKAAEKEEERRREFSVALSKDEIDEDFYAFTGRRAPARPKKIPRSLKRQLDVLFPGMGLTEVALTDYKVSPPGGRAARR